MSTASVPRFDPSESLKSSTQALEVRALEKDILATEPKNSSRINRKIHEIYTRPGLRENLTGVSFVAVVPPALVSGIFGAFALFATGSPVHESFLPMSATLGGLSLLMLSSAGAAFSGLRLKGPKDARRLALALEDARRKQDRAATDSFKDWLQAEYGMTTSVERLQWTDGVQSQKIQLTSADGEALQGNLVKIGDDGYELRRVESYSANESLYFDSLSSRQLTASRTPQLTLTTERTI